MEDMQLGLSEQTEVFSGYFLLPNRDLPYTKTGMDWDAGRIADWHSRRKLGEFSGAPVLVDEMQAWGRNTKQGEPQVLWWKAYPEIFMANHARRPSGAPSGGNFLFEDGHVSWYQWPRITLGSADNFNPG